MSEIADSQEISTPQEPYPRLFLRFLRFGLLAWGGPVAQIAMIRQELVEEERWISRARFNRVLAVYQALPGPEAHELCVYFGMLSRGRLGGVLGGLGFMLPGFILMFALSYLYVSYGAYLSLFDGVFWGFQTAVAALIVRAIFLIGRHAVTNGWLWGIAILTAIAQLYGISFLITLGLAGLSYVLVKRQASSVSITAIVGVPLSLLPLASAVMPTLPALFVYGLRSGLLTFGGAYTVIPFLQHDAVIAGGWMTNEQFLDGLALSSILPAPLIIFSTFVGYLGGGPLGALALTAGIFLPAFLFTLIGHQYLERLIQNKTIHSFLDGVTAGVVGLIAATTIGIFQTAIDGLPALVIFLTAFFVLFIWKAKIAVAIVVLAAGVVGLLLQ
jgi:chromate transporter